MPQRNPQCSAMDQTEHDLPPSHRQVDSNTETAVEGSKCCVSVQRNGDPASSSPESGSLNGEGKRSGKNRRRRKRTANPEIRPAVVEVKNQEEAETIQVVSQLDSSSHLLCLQAECASVWFEHSVYEQAESLYQCWLARTASRTTLALEAPPASENQLSPAPSVSSLTPAAGQAPSQQPAIPNSLPLVPSPPTSPATPDEGYQSLAPTPATPTLQAAPTSHQPINGLPRIPVELLRDVWLEKPLYDCAEAAFYQNLYGNHPGTSHSRVNSPSTSRSADHPQSLVEEEEEVEEDDEEKEEVLVSLEKTVVAQGKAESFHALHPIQEEEEPAEVMEEEELSLGGVGYFLHPDSERVWLERWRYDAAESRFHGHCESVKSVSEGAQSPGPDSRAPSSGDCTCPLRDNTMTAVEYLAQEKIWFDKPRYDEAERRYYEGMNGPSHQAQPLRLFQDVGANSILQDIARARENIQKSLAGNTGCGTGDQGEFVTRIRNLELENHSLHKVVEDFRLALSKLECRVAVLEKSPSIPTDPAAPCTNGTPFQQQKNCAPVKTEEDDDDFDLFGSDNEEDEEAERLKEERLKEYAERKAKKPALIAKSSILLDVKPWDDETDMAKLEECVRSVQADGLLWGQSKLVPVGYGIKKLQIACVVEDDKVGTDMLEEEITRFEDYVQSVDVAAFNKI